MGVRGSKEEDTMSSLYGGLYHPKSSWRYLLQAIPVLSSKIKALDLVLLLCSLQGNLFSAV